MVGTNVVSFEGAARATAEEQIHTIRDEELRQTQTVVALDDCHVALDRCSVIRKTKTSRFLVFSDLSAAFPKGRKMAILGHRGSGKSTLLDVLLARRSVHTGRVIVNSRISWPVALSNYLDRKLTLRQNLLFVGNVIGVDPGYLLGAACEVCGFHQKQLNERMNALPAMVKRRISLLIYLAADFDLHVIDGAFRPPMYGTVNDQLLAMFGAVLSRDFLATAFEPRQLPPNCDLAYILYHGRLFAFDDVSEAIRIYNMLPVPENPNPFSGNDQRDPDDDEDANVADTI